MSENTKIEWADKTWSPWRGCTKVSAGCANCYAEALASRYGETWGGWGKGKPRVPNKSWNDPLRWNRVSKGGFTVSDPPIKVFPSLCDWLDEEVPIELLGKFLKLIHDTPNLTWLLLTKRPSAFFERTVDAGRFLADRFGSGAGYTSDWVEGWVQGQPPSNVWVGTSVEDQPNNWRITALLQIPAKVRFLSLEPLLGPVDLKLMNRSFGFPRHITKEGCAVGMPQGIHWVIVGGESGPASRPCNIDWVRSGVKQCAAAGVACFVKQLGTRPVQFCGQHEHGSDCTVALKLTHPKGGDPDEWPVDIRVRQFPGGHV